MEDSVKDLDSNINPSTPEPRFSIGSKSPDTKDQIILFNKPIMLKKQNFRAYQMRHQCRNSLSYFR